MPPLLSEVLGRSYGSLSKSLSSLDDSMASAKRLGRIRHVQLMKTHGVLFMSQAPFGVFVVLARAALHTVSATHLLFLRLLGGLIVMLAFQHFVQKRNPLRTLFFELGPKVQRDVVLSALATSVGPLLFMIGLERTSAIIAAAIDSSAPAVALVVGLLFGLDSFRMTHAICIALSLTGNCLVLELWKFLEAPMSRREQASRSQEMLGLAAVFASVVCVVGNFYIQRPLLRIMAPEDLTTYVAFVGLIVVSVLACTELVTLPALWTESHTNLTMWMIAYAALLQGWSHNYFGSLAVKRSSPMLVSMYTSLVPAISALLGYAWLSEKVSGPQALGVVVVIASVILSAYFHESETKERDEPPAADHSTPIDPADLV